MQNPELYQISNGLQTQDTLMVLQEYNTKINWTENGGAIIDIGSGDGGTTTNVLKKYIPFNFYKIIGCDISDKMTRFAIKHHSDEKTSFIVFDIEGSTVPKYLRGMFKHAFSFYALQWIKNQTLAFTNIYDLLEDGGDCLLMFCGHSPIFEGYRNLARRCKWKTWLKDVERYVAYYQDMKEPVKEIQYMMDAIGFKNIEVISKKRSFNFRTLVELKNFVEAVNGFPLPKPILEDYLEDYIAMIKEGQLKDMIPSNCEGQTSVQCDYSILIVYANK